MRRLAPALVGCWASLAIHVAAQDVAADPCAADPGTAACVEASAPATPDQPVHDASVTEPSTPEPEPAPAPESSPAPDHVEDVPRVDTDRADRIVTVTSEPSTHDRTCRSDTAAGEKRCVPNRARFSAGIGEAVFWQDGGYSTFGADVGGSLAFDWQVLFGGPAQWFTIGPHVAWTHQAALTTGVAGVALGIANALDTTGRPRWPPFSVDLVLGAALVEDRRPSGVGFAFGWELGVRATTGYLVADGVGVLVGFEAAWIVGAQYDSLFLGGHLGYLGEWL